MLVLLLVGLLQGRVHSGEEFREYRVNREEEYREPHFNVSQVFRTDQSSRD